MKIIFPLIGFGLALLLGCQSEPSAPRPNAATQMPAVDTLSATEPAAPFFFGEVEALPNGLFQYASRLTGQIEDVWVLPGTTVQQGQPLFSIQSAEFISLQQQFLEAEAAYEAAKNEFYRTDTLFRMASVSKRNWEQAQKLFTETKAAFEGTTARLDWIGLSPSQVKEKGISSTFIQRAKRKGTIQDIKISRGSPVLQDMMLLTIVEPEAIQLRFRIPGTSVSSFTLGMEVQFGQQSEALTGLAKVTAMAPMPDAQGFFSLYAKPIRWPKSSLPAGERLLVKKP